MSTRSYSVYLKGGSAFNIKAARFEVTDEGVVFFDENDAPLADTFIDPASVIAVLPPSPSSPKKSTGFFSE